MKVDLYFKQFCIGTLSYENNEYEYRCNEANIENVKKYPSIMLFDLLNKTSIKSKTMFKFFFEEFVDNIRHRSDILQEIDKKGSEGDMEILYAYAGLNQNDFKFHVKQVRKESW